MADLNRRLNELQRDILGLAATLSGDRTTITANMTVFDAICYMDTHLPTVPRAPRATPSA